MLLRNATVVAGDGLYSRNRLEGGRVYLREVGSGQDGVLSRGREYPDSPVRPWYEGVVWCDDLYIDRLGKVLVSEWVGWTSRMAWDGRLLLSQGCKVRLGLTAPDGIGIYTCLGSACGQPSRGYLLVADSQARSFHGSFVPPPVPAQGAPPCELASPTELWSWPNGNGSPQSGCRVSSPCHPHTPLRDA